MPPRGRTTSPWWNHFQPFEGCTINIFFLILNESSEDFRQAQCLHCEKVVRRGWGSRDALRGKPLILECHRTCRPSTVRLRLRIHPQLWLLLSESFGKGFQNWFWINLLHWADMQKIFSGAESSGILIWVSAGWIWKVNAECHNFLIQKIMAFWKALLLLSN